MTTETIPPKTLSATEAQLLTTLSGRGQDIFGVREAEQVLGKSNAAVRKILYGLAKRHWLQRLEKGKYLIVPLSAGADSHYAENELVIAENSWGIGWGLNGRFSFSWTDLDRLLQEQGEAATIVSNPCS